MPTSTRSAELPLWWAVVNDTTQGNERGTYLALARRIHGNVGSPTGRIMPHGDRAPVVVRGRESRPHGEGGQVFRLQVKEEVCAMQDAKTVLGVIRDRGRRGLPLQRVYRQLLDRKSTRLNSSHAN